MHASVRERGLQGVGDARFGRGATGSRCHRFKVRRGALCSFIETRTMSCTRGSAHIMGRPSTRNFLTSMPKEHSTLMRARDWW